MPLLTNQNESVADMFSGCLQHILHTCRAFPVIMSVLITAETMSDHTEE
jgi:hypothetical protein